MQTDTIIILVVGFLVLITFARRLMLTKRVEQRKVNRRKDGRRAHTGRREHEFNDNYIDDMLDLGMVVSAWGIGSWLINNQSVYGWYHDVSTCGYSSKYAVEHWDTMFNLDTPIVPRDSLNDVKLAIEVVNKLTGVSHE